MYISMDGSMLEFLVAGYAGVAKWLSARYRMRNVYGITVSFFCWHDFPSSIRVSWPKERDFFTIAQFILYAYLENCNAPFAIFYFTCKLFIFLFIYNFF